MDSIKQMNYLNFENDQNNCWLDASIVLIVNSGVFKETVKNFPASQIKNLIATYNEALAILNDSTNIEIQQRYEKTRKMLRDIQKSTLTYLKQFLKFKAGEPESAFCALLNLIYHDKSKIKESISTSWIWQKNCESCGNSKSSVVTKPIITLSKVDSFNPNSPTIRYNCTCKEEQEMKLIYKEIPNCLIFHFEKGAGKGRSIPATFNIDKRRFHLTGIILLEKSSDPSINHFVTWIRQPFSELWLDCNDLNTTLVKFSDVKPELELRDLYMCMYEAYDNLGKISLVHDVHEEKSEEVNPEVIDLSNEGEDDVVKIAGYKKDVKEKEMTSNKVTEINDQEKHDIINHQNHSLNDKCVLSKDESPDSVKDKNEVDSTKYESKNVTVSNNVTETGEIHEEREMSNALNEKKEIPCTDILVSKKDILKKHEGQSVSPHKKHKSDFENTLAKLKEIDNKPTSGYFGYKNLKTSAENGATPENNKSLPMKEAADDNEKRKDYDNNEKRKDYVNEFNLEKQQLPSKRSGNTKQKASGKTKRIKQNTETMDQKVKNNTDEEKIKATNGRDFQKNPVLNEKTDNQNSSTSANHPRQSSNEAIGEEKLNSIINDVVDNVFAKFMSQIFQISGQNNS